jgi:hypothetical protein
MPLARLTDPIGQVRLGRYSSPGEVAVAELRAHGAQRPFIDLETGQAVAQALTRTEDLGYCRNLAWVLLPDRLIWLNQLLPDGGTLARLVGSLKGRSTWHIARRKPELGGRIWAAGYDDQLITTREELLEAIRMIVRRPVAQGLVARSGDYPFWDSVGLDRQG